MADNGNTGGNGLRLKVGLAEMLKRGVIMDVVNAEHAKIAEDAGAVAVMALERGSCPGAGAAGAVTAPSAESTKTDPGRTGIPGHPLTRRCEEYRKKRRFSPENKQSDLKAVAGPGAPKPFSMH